MNLNKKVSLVHIGLMKTATTTMQNIWLKDPGTCLVHGGLLPIVQKARVTGRNSESGGAIPLQWKYDTQPEEEQAVVCSQEALSTAYINERAPKSDIKRFQHSAAKLMGMIASGAKILITVRQPEAWIKSIYNQSVKMGGIDSFPEFLTRENHFLKQSLNILDMLDIWGEPFGKQNILVLPVEFMRNDREGFFKVLADFSGVSVPDSSIVIEANPSMKPEHLKLMKRFNEWVKLFAMHGIYQSRIPQQVKQALMQLRFAVRYSLESPSAKLEELVAETEAGLPDCDIDLSYIDDGFLSRIKSGYQKMLKEDDFYGYRDLYCGG